jgi:deoxyribose-phosphate aldolase
MPTERSGEILTIETLAKTIDHTLLAADHKTLDVERVCEEAIGYGFATVTVAPYDVPRAVRLLAGADVAVGGTVGIPLGHSGLRAKRTEAQTCVDAGAAEIDVVMNLTAAKSGLWSDVRDEIAALRKVTNGRVLKVILECCYLTDDEKVQAARTAVDAGADFVKTSTGFGRGGATVDDIALLKRTVGDRAQVKAAGGLRTLAQCVAMLDAGAVRLGTSAGIAILQELKIAGTPIPNA